MKFQRKIYVYYEFQDSFKCSNCKKRELSHYIPEDSTQHDANGTSREAKDISRP